MTTTNLTFIKKNKIKSGEFIKEDKSEFIFAYFFIYVNKSNYEDVKFLKILIKIKLVILLNIIFLTILYYNLYLISIRSCQNLNFLKSFDKGGLEQR